MDQRRYKQRSSQFNSTLDSRALRAVKCQEGWRAQRHNAITNRRHMESLNDSVESTRPNKSIIKQETFEDKAKKTKKELGIERYRQLLKWKEDKKKTLDKEKRRRRPSFKTGLYQPETPKFLVSADGDLGTSVSETPGKKTPFKFLVSSTKKSSITPSIPGTVVRRKLPVFHTGVTPGSSVQRVSKFSTGATPTTSVPRFHTGVTPNDMLKIGGILTNDSFSKKKSLKLQKDQVYKVSSSTRAGLRTARPEESKNDVKPFLSRDRLTRWKTTMDQEELGVKPLPATPKPNQALITKRRKRNDVLSSEEVASFAPSDFTFNFEASDKPSFDFPPNDNGSVDGDGFEDGDKFIDFQSEGSLRNVAKVAEKIGIEKDKPLEADNVHMADAATGLRQEDTGVSCKAREKVQDSGMEEDQQEVDQHGQIHEAEEQAEKPEAEEQAEGPKVEEQAEEHEAEEQAEKPEAEEQAEGPEVEEQAEESKAAEQVVTTKVEELECEKQVEELECEKQVEEIKAEEQVLKERFESEIKPLLNTVHSSDGVQVTAGNSDKVLDIIKGEIKKMDEDKEGAFDNKSDGATSVRKTRNSSRRGSVATPRKSIACCGEGVVTPSMSRLRPRTPCSRNTRRSLSAHCDPQPEIFTPSRRTPGRKSFLRSVKSVQIIPEFSFDIESMALNNTVGKVEQIIENEQMHVDAAVEDQEQFKVPDVDSTSAEKKLQITPKADELSSSSLLITPRSLDRQSKVSWKVETSPWIDVSRRSRKRRSCSTPDFQKFPEIPTDGSPLPAHLIPEVPTYKTCESPMVYSDKKTDSAVVDDQPCVELLALLKPSLTAAGVDSPDINVWGEATPVARKSVLVTTDVAVNMDPHSQTTPGSSCEIMNRLPAAIDQSIHKTPLSSVNTSFPLEVASTANSPKSWKSGAEKVPDQSLVSDSAAPGKAVTRKRKSRRSVMFAVDQENEAPTFRFPGTPIRSSSRASMGLFNNVDMNTDDTLPSRHEDFFTVESPKSEKKTAATRRKSSRVSLLPGMTRSPLMEQTLPVNCDLISWDTPVETKENKSRSIVSKFATPNRRSGRLIKAQVL